MAMATAMAITSLGAALILVSQDANAAAAGNLAAGCYLAGLWWHGQRERSAGDPAWLREAMAADAAARERRRAELGLDPADQPGRDGEVA